MAKCEQCNKNLENDMLALFTQYQICKQCVRKNHEKTTRKTKKERRK